MADNLKEEKYEKSIKRLELLVESYQASKKHIGWKEVSRGKKQISIEETYYKDSIFNEIVTFFVSGISYECSKWYILSFDPADLEQECKIVLCGAAKSWNRNKSASFKTYAWRCIKNCLQDMRNGGFAAKEMKLNQSCWDSELLELVAVDKRIDQEELELKYNLTLLSNKITDRQKIVLTGLLSGKDKQEIAKELGLSPMTISWVVRDLRESKEIQDLFSIGWNKEKKCTARPEYV